MRPSPLKTVIINVTRLIINTLKNFTRQYAVCSAGDTNLSPGSGRNVNVNTYEDLFTKPDYQNTDTYKFLNAFFTNNYNGSVKVVELGNAAQPQHTLADTVGNWKSGSINGTIALNVNNIVLTIAGVDGAEGKEIILGDKTAKLPLTLDLSSQEGLNITGAMTVDLSGAAIDFKPSEGNSNASPFNSAFKLENSNASVSQGPIDVLKKFIQETSERSYMYALPNSLYGNESLVSLIKLYSDFSSGQYFMITGDFGENLNTSSKYAPYKKLKPLFYVSPSAISSESVAGALMALMASNVYELSEVNPLSLFEYKIVKGITPLSPSSLVLQSLIDNGANWIGEKADNTVVFGGTFADGTGFEYYYALDSYLFTLSSSLETAIIKGANNPRQAVYLSQLGIDKMKAICESVSNNFVNYKAIEAFGVSRDKDDIIENNGHYGAIDFITYKKQYPLNVKNGIYSGLYADIDFKAFMVQVALNIGIN